MNVFRLSGILCLLVAGLAAAACQPILVQPPPPSPTAGLERCQELVDSFKALHAGLELPDHLRAEDAMKTGDEFDVNAYFTVLDRLSMEPGYVLDYVYYGDMMGGQPVLYARPADQSPYATFAELEAALAGQPAAAARASYLAHLIADGSDESYLQLAILHLLGNQFYLFWHANYHDAQVLCDQEALERLLATEAWYGEGETIADMLATEQLQAMRGADLAPRVEVDAGSVRVRAVIFSHWGGLTELTWTIDRASPQDLQLAIETLVDYMAPVLF